MHGGIGLVDEPLPADQVVEPDETPEDAAKAEAEPDEEDPASIGAVEESLAVWGGGGTRSRPWERGEGWRPPTTDRSADRFDTNGQRRAVHLCLVLVAPFSVVSTASTSRR